jgi:protein gp37
LETVRHYPRQTFLFLTKNPARYWEFSFPENCWLGATAGDNANSYDRARALEGMENITFLSCEPLISPMPANDSDWPRVDWVIIGAMTGPGAKRHAPEKEWIADIVNKAKGLEIPIFMKDNLKSYLDGEFVKEFPG